MCSVLITNFPNTGIYKYFTKFHIIIIHILQYKYPILQPPKKGKK